MKAADDAVNFAKALGRIVQFNVVNVPGGVGSQLRMFFRVLRSGRKLKAEIHCALMRSLTNDGERAKDARLGTPDDRAPPHSVKRLVDLLISLYFSKVTLTPSIFVLAGGG